MPTYLVLNFGLGGEPVDPPDLGEHGPVRETEAEGETPGPQTTYDGELFLADELPVEPQQEDGAQTQDDAHQR
ncbi:hypothetical protein Pmani_019469 [Petrolisthes manimaculis]|uniref:Uncharacterized protein n=1 Tax=Petrolisthes manimaculis TaxID=1843537 RepID=A0AAE1U7C6_9EUCA|nr:hypothetical protein Pmani_019469 [Petrolisthes manimaculis]